MDRNLEAIEKKFDVNEVFDLSKVNGGEPLKMHFVDGGKTMYITTANPISIRTFVLVQVRIETGEVFGHRTRRASRRADPRRTLRLCAEFIHQFSRHADGSVSVVDLKSQKVVASMDTLKTWD